MTAACRFARLPPAPSRTRQTSTQRWSVPASRSTGMTARKSSNQQCYSEYARSLARAGRAMGSHSVVPGTASARTVAIAPCHRSARAKRAGRVQTARFQSVPKSASTVRVTTVAPALWQPDHVSRVRGTMQAELVCCLTCANATSGLRSCSLTVVTCSRTGVKSRCSSATTESSSSPGGRATTAARVRFPMPSVCRVAVSHRYRRCRVAPVPPPAICVQAEEWIPNTANAEDVISLVVRVAVCSERCVLRIVTSAHVVAEHCQRRQEFQRGV